MKFNPITICAATIAAATTLTSAAPFTYQGSLQDSGAPADGEYDFRFELYTDAVGGSQIGPTLTFDDLQVTDGTFQVDVDFNNNFDDSPVYLFVEVRDGRFPGGYTGLLPRTEITATPKAQHATTATTAAALSNPQWETSGSTIFNTPSTDTVFINRDRAITLNEVFGIYGDTPDFVGMYSAGPANSKPFYGYAVDGESTAFSFFESADGTWRLQLGLDQPIIADGPDIIAGDKVIANNFQYKSPKTGYASVMGDSFHSSFSNSPFIASGDGGAYFLDPVVSGTLIAPIQLPHGATVTKLRAYFTDNSPSSTITAILTRKFHGVSNLFTSASVNSDGLAGSNFLVESTAISTPLVDNNQYSYQLRIFSQDWIGDGSLRIQSIVVEYTTTQTD